MSKELTAGSNADLVWGLTEAIRRAAHHREHGSTLGFRLYMHAALDNLTELEDRWTRCSPPARVNADGSIYCPGLEPLCFEAFVGMLPANAAGKGGA